MAMQDWSENIVVVDLPNEPGIAEELENVTNMVRDRGNCDVVVDFTAVDIITSSSLSAMLRLHKLLTDCGHRIVLCSVAPATKSVFTITGVNVIFDFVEDKFTALAGLQLVNQADSLEN